MKKTFTKLLLVYLLAGALVVNSPPLFGSVAATSVETDITEDTVWAVANSPYEIRSDIKVNKGVTLTIERGVVVSFDENTALTVEGSLIAIGNSSSPITFTSNQPDPTRGQWTNIRFVGGGNETFILKFVNVTYAQNGIVIEGSGNALIEKSVVAYNALSGIHVIGQGNVVIKGNTIKLNGNGITTVGKNSSGVQIVGNYIVFNDEYGIYLSSSGADFCRIYNVTISSNYISRNRNGIYMFSNAETENDEAHIYNVTISSNFIAHSQYGMRLRTHGWYAGYIYDSTIFNNTVVFNTEGINIYSGSNWYSWISDVTISKNEILANEDGISLEAFRTPEPPYKNVPFDTIMVENVVSANNNTGINIKGDVRANLTRNSVSYNSYGIYITSADNLARKNDIYRNSLYGMYVMRAHPAVQAQVNAEDNFWGAATGPFHESLNPDGQGDRVNGDGENLDFYPFLDAPVGFINEPPVAKLTISETKVTLNQTVILDGSISKDDTRVMKYFFDFGDGENSGWVSIPVTNHKYVSPGLYNVSLIVMDEYGVKSNNTAVEMVRVTLSSLVVSVSADPIFVSSQGQVFIEVRVTAEESVGVENVSVQLTSDKGGNFDPQFGYTNLNGDFNSTFYAPEVSESISVEITVTVSKEGYESSSKQVSLLVVKAPSTGTSPDMSWIWPVGALAAIAVASVLAILKRRRRRRRFAKQK